MMVLVSHLTFLCNGFDQRPIWSRSGDTTPRGMPVARRRTRPRLFAFSRETEHAHLDQLGLGPEERALMERVVAGFQRIVEHRDLSEEWLAPIVEAACADHPVVCGLGMQRLVVMSHYFPRAETALTDVCSDPSVSVRLFAVANLANAPMPFAFPLIARALADSEWTIRKAAATVCTAIAAEELGEIVRQRLAVEHDARVRVVLELAARFQRNTGETSPWD